MSFFDNSAHYSQQTNKEDNMKDQFEKVVKKAINMIVDIDLYEWPPKCSALYYQPVRPCKKDAVQAMEPDKTDRMSLPNR